MRNQRFFVLSSLLCFLILPVVSYSNPADRKIEADCNQKRQKMKECEEAARGKCELPKDKDGKPVLPELKSKNILESLKNPIESAEMSRQIAENNKKSFLNLEEELKKCKKIMPDICKQIDKNHKDAADKVERRRQEAQQQAQQYEQYERRAAQAVRELSQQMALDPGAFSGETGSGSGGSGFSGGTAEAHASQPTYYPGNAGAANESPYYETGGGYAVPTYVPPPVRQAAPVAPPVVQPRQPTQTAAYNPLKDAKNRPIPVAVFAPTLADKPLPAATAPAEAGSDGGMDKQKLMLEIEGAAEQSLLEDNSDNEEKAVKKTEPLQDDDTSFFGSLGAKFFQSLGIGSPIENADEDDLQVDPAPKMQEPANVESHAQNEPEANAQPPPHPTQAQKIAALSPEVRKRAKEIGLEEPELVKIMGLHEIVQPEPKDPILENDVLPAMNNSPVLASDLGGLPENAETQPRRIQPVRKTKYGALVPTLADESDRYGN